MPHALTESELKLQISEAYRLGKYDDAVRLEKQLSALQENTL